MVNKPNTALPTPPKKVGRPQATLESINLPSDWKEIIYKMSSEGCSEVEIRAELLMQGGKFSQKTWDALKEREEEFLLTIKQAKVLCEAWWINAGRKCLDSRSFQAFVWFCNMKNRFHWKDKSEVEANVNFNLKDTFETVTRATERNNQEMARFASN